MFTIFDLDAFTIRIFSKVGVIIVITVNISVGVTVSVIVIIKIILYLLECLLLFNGHNGFHRYTC